MGEFIALVTIGAPLTLLLHELAHAAVAKYYGARIEHFRPWPHTSLRGTGRFYLGAVYLRWPVGRPEVHVKRMLIAPFYKAVVFCLIWATVSVVWYLPVAGLAVWELIDAAAWRWMRDGERYQRKG